MRAIKLIIALFITVGFLSCQSSSDKSLKPGTWRATLTRDGQTLPVILDIAENPDGKTYTVYSVNAGERLKMDTAYFEKDSLHIPMQLFDSEITAAVDGEKLTGVYKRLDGDKVTGSLPFNATFGADYRFFKEEAVEGVKNVTGKYATIFKNEVTKDSTEAVGSFTQKGSIVEGSFLTPTGDYRYLSGNVKGDSLYLSTFDGSNAYLIKAAILKDGVLKGSMWSGIKGYKTFTSILNENAKLPDATKLTYLKPGSETVDFTFPDADGKPLSLKDPRFKGKPVIIQIMGSWCPNCMDETNFLAPWYTKNKSRGVEIVGLAFEHSDDLAVSAPKLKRMESRFGIEYPVLLAGTNTNEATAKALPMLNKVMSYPTTIFIDKKGKVREIHTGFSGPGTGKYYDEFVADFNQLMDKLISEK
ncbi:TlpA family protein disulfide reductase [Dyadobacter sp. CY345]|uniref:peroxiredoxin family protein n=1 Tax=Dyadobacter sp. CY345 TaxID=2909335 RepID=UPI001F39964E|nr:TlpA disulfide reductase family protein [Dyadobacter sp. CY345]MCF2445191.1 TlpA family protein disulfide reductase [Dyadobacter sp. CY345]